MDLQDMRYFLALARHGRLVVAADRLGVEHTTVSRRVQALEKSCGVRLFERSRTGWELTDAGRRLLPHAETIEAAAQAALEEATGGEMTPAAGVVRVVATDGFGSSIVVPALARLHERHPEISIELLTTSHLLSFRVGEFDVALTLHKPQLSHFLTRKACEYALRLYASPAYLAARPRLHEVGDLHQHRMVWYIDSLNDLPELRVMDEVLAEPEFALRSSNVFAQREAVVSGFGIGLLPSFMAEGHPGLEPVLADRVEVRRTFWLVISSRLVNVRRIQIVYQHLLDVLPDYAAVLIPASRE